MAKRHSRHKQKRRKRQPLDPVQLLENARVRLRQGQAREAIDVLKQARHGDGGSERLDLALACAYCLRARQLAARGMAGEARAMRERARDLSGALARPVSDEEERVDCARCLDMADAVAVYAGSISRSGSSVRVERILADRAVVEDDWTALAALDEEHPLRQDCGSTARAVGEMQRGAWQQAGAALAGIGRRSPYAPWRLFCKAMACYAAGDDRSALRALDSLPEEFALPAVVSELRRACGAAPSGPESTIDGNTGAQSKENGGPARDRVRRALGLYSSQCEDQARMLLEFLRKGRARDLERLLPPLAAAVCPEDPGRARVALFEILIMAALELEADAGVVDRALRRLLPGPQALAVAARVAMVSQSPERGTWDTRSAAAYWENLEAEFPGEGARRLARAQVLEWVARCGRRAVPAPYWLHPDELSALWRLAGRAPGDSAGVFVSLMEASLEADPANREGHLFLLDMLRGDGASHRSIERALRRMEASLAQDPEPCLMLAGHYHARNAYRKAEAALSEARRRAPHDDRILDREAIGRLKSADENRKRGRWHLAEADIGQAEVLGRRRVEPIILVKRLALELASGGPLAGPGPAGQLTLDLGGRTSAPVDPAPHLESLAPAMRLRSLALLVSDLEGAGSHAAPAARQWLYDEAESMADLGPDEVVALLAPIEEDFAMLFGGDSVAGALSDYWPALMGRLDGDHLLSVFDVLLGCDGDRAVSREIDRRLAGQARAERDPLLLFHLEVIRQLDGRSSGSRRFEQIIEGAGGAQIRALRQAASRLARHAAPPLREALQGFSFEILDAPSLFGGDHDLPYPELGADPFEDLADSILGDVPIAPEWLDESDEGDLLQELEDLVDRTGMRGAPVSALRDFAGSLRADPAAREVLDLVAEECTASGEEVSRELNVLLFPRRKSATKRRR